MVTITLSVNQRSGHISAKFLDWLKTNDHVTRGKVRPDNDIFALLDELAKFLFLSAHAEAPVSPTKELDDLWHALILWDLEAYLKFCTDLTGRPVYHKRTNAPYPRKNIEKAAKYHKITLNPAIWRPDEQNDQTTYTHERSDLSTPIEEITDFPCSHEDADCD